jgi:hypothetical protein
MNFITRWLKPAPVVVQTYKTRKTDLEAKRFDLHLRLAAETGKPFPLRLRFLEQEIVSLADGEGR